MARAGTVCADPLYAKNLAPVAGLIGFPNMRDAATLPRGEFQAAVHGNVANNYSVDVSGEESVNFDVETRRVAFRGSVGLGAGFELEAPRATMYLWIPVPGEEPSEAFGLRALESEGVIVLPGASLGAGGEGFFRVALTVGEERLEEAARRLGRVVA